MDRRPERYLWPKLTQEATKNLNRPVTDKEMEPVILRLPPVNSTKYFKRNTILHKLSPEQEKTERSPIHSARAASCLGKSFFCVFSEFSRTEPRVPTCLWIRMGTCAGEQRCPHGALYGTGRCKKEKDLQKRAHRAPSRCCLPVRYFCAVHAVLG